MADAAVEILLENLKQLLLQHAHLIPDAMNQVKRLEKTLVLVKHLELPQHWMRELIRRLRCLLYDAEDIVDTCANQANADSFLHDPIHGPSKIVDIVDEVEDVVKKFRNSYGHKRNKYGPIKSEYTRQDETEGSVEQKHHVKQVNMVGLEDEIKKLKSYLFDDCSELDVITIVGMAGLGKTTLADNIFNDLDIRAAFPIRVWVYVSQEFTRKEIFLGILEEFTIITDDIKSKTDEMLADLVVSYLKNETFLLVMDDVWSCRDWYRLSVALPTRNERSRVLITTRIEQVGIVCSRYRPPHHLRSLHWEESESLLKAEVFRNKENPEELERIIGKIAKGCRGHPLAIVLIGGMLVSEFSSDMMTRKETWEIFYKSSSVAWQVADEYPWSVRDREDLLKNIIELSYEKLSYHLKECFLYLGMFPEDFEIPAWKLIQLWIAEGFIPQHGGVNLEKTAEKYLEELITRKLIKAVKFKLDGKVKTCRVHDTIRDFCIAEAGNEREGFSQEIKTHRSSQTPVSAESKFRRLCIHSNFLNFVSTKPCGPCVRSFIYSSRDEITIPMEDISTIPKGFKLLRVLDVEPNKFNHKLPRDMFQLYHLRYLVLSVNLRVLPAAFSKLWNIQTLVVNTNSRTLEIKADLLNMTRLMHFKTKASSALPTTSRSSEAAGREIHTLGAIAPESCTKDFFDRAPNLKRLGVRGKLALLLDVNNESLDSFGKLSNLEKLKLLNDVHPVPPSGAQLCGLPPTSKFPPKLKILTLSRTSLDWCHMSILASLESLEVLKLKDKAFVGDKWEVADGGFCHLEVLHIERTNLKNWLASDHHFPSLKHLQLKHCDYLDEVPMELAHVQSFMKLDLFHCKRAAASALEIGKRKRHEDQRSNDLVPEFKLSIFPWRTAHASV